MKHVLLKLTEREAREVRAILDVNKDDIGGDVDEKASAAFVRVIRKIDAAFRPSALLSELDKEPG